MADKINAESMQAAYNENYQMFLAKNADYGNSFEKSLNDFGYVAGIVRISDKYNRLYNLISSDKNVSESLSDTLNDMANYCTMLAIWLEKTENANDTRS
ncbi:phage protein [Streptococcus agalactiae]|uniref:nucleotide modification associated domain-containing protein n=1 Tax=Streptococcus agalactiae TaxID=1311 RepID=UPI0006403B71|nr:nucleotide modification associated domain-containing protein [Streptococcus agalactiae]KLL31794.1 phage protein [Streptococcus agalactiae]